MVVIDRYSSSQFNVLPNVKGRVLYDTTNNVIRFNNNTDFSNILLYKDETGNVTGINNFTVGGILNLSNAGSSGNGLQLNGTLVTASAAQLNYTNVTPGTVSATAAMVVDSSRNIVNLNKLNTTGNVGINTSATVFGLEVNEQTGNCLRLSYNDDNGTATHKCDFELTPTGSLTITPTGSNPTVAILANMSTTNVSSTKTALLSNAVDYPFTATVLPNGAASNGLGAGIEFNTMNDAYTLFNLGTLEYYATDISDGNETSHCRIRLCYEDAFVTAIDIDHNGNVSGNSFIETSDIRTKENILDAEIDQSRNKINQLDVKTYNYIQDSQKRAHIGLIAQEVKDIIPEVVFISQTAELPDFHQIHYSGLIPHLINCTKDIYKRLDEINKKLDQLLNE